MNRPPKQVNRFRKWLVAALLVLVVVAVSGCQTLSFYSQAIRGQYQILAHRRPLQKLIAEPQTPAALRAKLELIEQLRAFARAELKLPVDDHYRKYVDVHRQFVVWNVEAASEFSLEPKTWWYPLVGSLEYRGYFSERGAGGYAQWLRKKGFDVYVGGVEAYSTLGWFKDPVLNTFISEPEAELAEIIFHELGHQRLFARSDTDFNEAFATTVGQEGARRWLRAKGDTDGYDRYVRELRRNTEFVHLIMATRVRLATLYGDQLTKEGRITAARKKQPMPREQLRQQKEAILAGLRLEYAQIKKQWGGNNDYDEWFAGPINNAQLNSVAAYYDFVPGFEHMLLRNGGNLEEFYREAERLSKKPKKERHEWLEALGQKHPSP